MIPLGSPINCLGVLIFLPIASSCECHYSNFCSPTVKFESVWLATRSCAYPDSLSPAHKNASLPPFEMWVIAHSSICSHSRIRGHRLSYSHAATSTSTLPLSPPLWFL